MEEGAPRPGWKATFHGPSIARSFDSFSAASVRVVWLVGLRKTTKTVPQGSSLSGTVVAPFAIVNDAGLDFPVSAYQNSGSLPVTRKTALADTVLSVRLSTK